MRTLVAFPSTASFGQQAALAFHECDALADFATTYVYREEGTIGRILSVAPPAWRARIEAQLKRRQIAALPPEVIKDQAFWEVVRTAASMAGASPPTVDRIWDRMSHVFTRSVGRRLTRGVDAIYAYEYTALEAFDTAEKRGIAKILDFPSLNSRQYEALQQREKQRFADLRSAYDGYFDARFESRQARRDAEMARADVIITNSSVSRASHIEGGADPVKTFAVPYGAPPAADTVRPRNRSDPLRVIWAGSFSVRKGAHHFLEAWRALDARGDMVADIYGAVLVPEKLWKSAPDTLVFHGSVVQPVLFEAFDRADVLVFPTLSDGFGMVVTEALSRGLPVITTDQAGASDLIEHERNGLIIPAGDPEAIAQALRWSLNNRECLAAMRPAALETAKNWQWSDYRRALIGAVSTGLTRAGYTPTFKAPAYTSVP